MEPWQIDAAAVQAYQDAQLDLPTAYQGFPFDPETDVPAGSAWIRLHWLPVSRDQRLQTVDRIVGILQLDVHYPMGRGTRAIKETAGALLAHFRPFRRFAFDTGGITVLRREEGAARDVNGWQTLIVSVTFRTMADRDFG